MSNTSIMIRPKEQWHFEAIESAKYITNEKTSTKALLNMPRAYNRLVEIVDEKNKELIVLKEQIERFREKISVLRNELA